MEPSVGRKEASPEKKIVLTFSGHSIANYLHPYRNEDTIGFDIETNFAIVLDGVGGSVNGQAASRKALEIIENFIIDDFLGQNKLANLNEAEERLRQLIVETSQRVHKEIDHGATTLVLAKILTDEGRTVALVANVGDSRAYLLHDGKLVQITKDDSIVPEDVLSKIDHAQQGSDLNDDEYDWFHRRYELTQHLGSGHDIDVHFYCVDLKTGDRVLLTTDGVHDNLSFEELEEIAISEGDLARKLAEKAWKHALNNDTFRSKADDVSAVVIEAD